MRQSFVLVRLTTHDSALLPYTNAKPLKRFRPLQVRTDRRSSDSMYDTCVHAGRPLPADRFSPSRSVDVSCSFNEGQLRFDGRRSVLARRHQPAVWRCDYNNAPPGESSRRDHESTLGIIRSRWLGRRSRSTMSAPGLAAPETRLMHTYKCSHS
jgi:hypothetical protein